MTSGLTWLNELMTWFGRWIPRIVLIEPTHRGVRFGPKGDTRQVGPGIVVYWPITHSLVQIPVTTQSIQLSGQAITEAVPDGAIIPVDAGIVPRVTICSVAVQFRVRDAILAATRSLNMHALIDNRGQAAIANHAQGDRGLWLTQAQAELATAVHPFGIDIERLDLTQFGVGVALKNVESGNWHDTVNGKRPE